MLKTLRLTSHFGTEAALQLLITSWRTVVELFETASPRALIGGV